MKHYLLILCLCMGAIGSGRAQTCYLDFLNKGIALYNDLRFDAAIDNFKAAIICPDRPSDLFEVTDWLSNAQDGFFNAIQEQKKLVEAALQEAKRERAAADSARVVAEASRYGLMARNALSVNDTNALILSYSALRLMDGMEVPGSLKNAFGEASHKFFSQTRQSELSPIFSILALADPAAIAMESGEGAIGLLYLEGSMDYRRIGRHQAYLTNLQYAPQYKKLLSTDIEGNIKTWDLTTYQSVEYPSHEREVTAAAFARQNPVFLTVSKDQSSKLWDLTGRLKEQLPAQKGVPLDIQVSPTGYFLVRSADGGITVWNADGLRVVELSNPRDFIYDAQLSPDGQYILTASADKTAKIWNMAGQEMASLTHFFAVRSAIFSPDGNVILTRTKGNTAKLWDRQGQLLAELEHQDQLTLSAFSPSGNFIITGSKDNTVKIWTIKGRLLQTLEQQASPVAAYFSPDEELVLTTAEGSDSKLWDVEGNLLRTIPLNASNTIPSIFSADGRYVISVIADQVINVCPVPEEAKRMIEEQKPISESRIGALERQFGIQIQSLW